MASELSRVRLEQAAEDVRRALAPTPQIAWPLLSERLGAETWVKHENHQPVGAFKVRGGVHLLASLRSRGVARVVAATRGNHGQSVAWAARRMAMRATVVVPLGNSRSKNEAMRALGAELVEHGRDFQDALEHARALAAERGSFLVPSFSLDLVRGVASCALELLRAADPDVVYVPVGLGSGICGALAARDALGSRAEVVGVVAANAPCYALSFEAGAPVRTPGADTLADGLAVRVPDPEALALIRAGAARVVAVTEEEIRAAMRHLFDDTHNVAEGAGAAPLAAALRERAGLAGRRVALVLSGGNVDRDLFARVLAEAP